MAPNIYQAEKINNFTKDVGYTFTEFNNLNSDNIDTEIIVTQIKPAICAKNFFSVMPEIRSSITLKGTITKTINIKDILFYPGSFSEPTSY